MLTRGNIETGIMTDGGRYTSGKYLMARLRGISVVVVVEPACVDRDQDALTSSFSKYPYPWLL